MDITETHSWRKGDSLAHVKSMRKAVPGVTGTRKSDASVCFLSFPYMPAFFSRTGRLHWARGSTASRQQAHVFSLNSGGQLSLCQR